jgi:hypothetical protein
VDEGMHDCVSMSTIYMIFAKLEHNTCMVDLLGYGGHLHEVELFIMTMPYKIFAWKTLLHVCKIHGKWR